MESNFLFRPRVELLFFDGNATADDSCSTNGANNAMQYSEGDRSRKDLSDAKIVIRIYFDRNSILFQVRTNA